MSTTDEIRLRNLDLRITKENTPLGERVIDIEVKITDKKRSEFLNHFKQKNISWRTNSYTGLVQEGLSNYHYHKKFIEKQAEKKNDPLTKLMKMIQACLKPCAQLERLINNPPRSKDCFEQLADLKKAVESCKTALIEIFTSHEPEGQAINILENNFDQFIKQIEAFEKSPPTALELQQLFCSQDGAINGSLTIQSLGSFLASQLHFITGYGIDEVYRITDQASQTTDQVDRTTDQVDRTTDQAGQTTDQAGQTTGKVDRTIENRMTQLIFVHPAIKELSDVKSHLEIRTLSAQGARTENSQIPIPGELLDLIEALDDEEEEQIEEKEKEQTKEKKEDLKWLSLKPYLNQFKDVEEVNKMLFLLSPDNTDKPFNNPAFNWTWHGLFVLGSVLEVLTSSIHMALSIFSFGVDIFLLGPINKIFGSSFSSERFDNLLTRVHSKLSFATFCKNKLREKYTETYKPDEKKFFDSLWKHTPHNFLFSAHETIDTVNELNAYISLYSGHRSARIFRNWVSGVATAILNLGSEFKYTFTPSKPHYRQLTFREKQKAIADQYNELKSLFNDEKQKIFGNKVTEALKQNEAEAATEKKESEQVVQKSQAVQKDAWTPGRPWTPNEFSSFLDVPEEILTGLANQFIDKMFRHNPGTATFSFMLSLATFGVLMTPSSANTKLKYMGYFAEWLSKHFTGKTIAEGSMPKLVSVFLQWKIMVLTSELGVELSHLNVDFLRATFKDLDRMALIIVTLIALGNSLQIFKYYPILTQDLIDPSAHPLWDKTALLIPHLINSFGEEAAESNQGSFPLRYVEQLTLGFKSILMSQSALEIHPREKVLDIDKIIRRILDLAEKREKTEAIKAGAEPETGATEANATAEATAEAAEATAAVATEAAIEEVATLLDLSDTQAPNPDAQRQYEELIQIFENIGFNPLTTLATKEFDNTVTGDLRQALYVVNQMEGIKGGGFKTIEEAWFFYDYLDEQFDDYIKERDSLGFPISEECFLKERYLANFDNKYCNSSLSGILRFMSIVPLYPLTLTWRLCKYIFSYSPYVKNEVRNSFIKDAAMLIQLPIACLRLLRTAARASSYSLRPLLLTAGILIASPGLLTLCALGCKKDAREIVSGLIIYTTAIRFHRFSGTGWLKTLQAKLAMHCNMSQEKEYLKFYEDRLQEKLDKNEGLKSDHSQLTKLVAKKEKQKKSPHKTKFFSSAKSAKLVEQARIISASSLEEKHKATKLRTLFEHSSSSVVEKALPRQKQAAKKR